MFLAANTRWPATASSVFELTAYFEMIFLEILPSVQEADFPRAGHILLLMYICIYISYVLLYI